MSRFDLGNFKKFDPGASARVIDRITVARTNTIQLPKFFYKKNRLEDKTYVRLLFNKEDREIAIVFLGAHEPGSYKLCGREQYGRFISPKSSLEINEIRMANTTRYPYEKHVHEGDTYYVICLDNSGKQESLPGRDTNQITSRSKTCQASR